ncbi:histidine kinase [Prauserella sp. PE36]|uniref:sensor histidine kinase n=1 Tax=Prauserella sp. PE36 TaxID=1504709 RepID=UPI000DE3E62E|nr:histidine kinase [Prauserella sp. PE36]
MASVRAADVRGPAGSSLGSVLVVLDQNAEEGLGAAGAGAPAAPNAPQPAPEGAAEQERSRRGLRNWRVRSKLALVLIIPTATALVLGGLRAIDALDRADEFQQTAEQVDLAISITSVVHELQAERTLAVATVASNGDPRRRGALDAQILQVDRAVSQLRGVADEIETEDPSARDRYDRGIQRLDALAPLRNAINSSPFSDVSALSTYSSILDELVRLGREVNTAVTDQDLLREGTTIQAVSEAKEFVARQDAALQIAALHNEFPADLLDQARSAFAGGEAAVETFNAFSSPEQRQLFSDTVSGPEVDGRQRIREQSFVRAELNEPLFINSNELANNTTVTLDKFRTVESQLLDNLRAHAGSLADSATTAAWRDSGIVLAALAAALLLMLAIARLMLGPLRVLRSSALEVAYVRLPETVRRILADPNPIEASRNAIAPVPVYTREEIGEVARSFDVVHERAIRMAAEQALLRENVNGIFVNLSRRSQRLVERQLGVIDQLEADEQDPDQLASLFELDHLATRLRRNGESLLVLSGAGLAKSVSRPVPAADVVGAAVSEIEQYARVEVGTIPDVAVQGRAIHDLVHLLAELLDNATYFSEPDTRISVRAVVTRRHALAIQITDRGVGMTEQQLTEANERLADPPDLDVSVTRRMGLYVVARLAKRHGIEVRLRENEDIEGGVIARVVVPTELLTSPPQAEEPVASPRISAQRNGSHEDISSPSLPPITSLTDPAETTQLPSTSPAPANPQALASPSSGEPQRDANGLVPLDQPISLDDLVGGATRAAGPFVSSAPPEPPPAPEREPEPQWPVDQPEAETSNGRGHGPGDSDYTLALPKREPRYVPVTPEQPAEHEPAGGDGSALEDDVPTRRLPIYQSVLSRWFSEEEPEQEQPEPEQQVEPESYAEEPPATSEDEWRSVSDSGWQAAHALLESKDEEITPAGLPKRVPNAYLVPGSIRPAEGDAFRDTTVGKPGQGAIARSADAARNRMMSFQRGYQSGRHALKEPSAEGTQFDSVTSSGSGDRSTDNGAKE